MVQANQSVNIAWVVIALDTPIKIINFSLM